MQLKSRPRAMECVDATGASSAEDVSVAGRRETVLQKERRQECYGPAKRKAREAQSRNTAAGES